MNGDDFSKEIRKDEEDAYKEGVHGVPYFIVDGKQVIHGASSKGVMKEILLNALKKNSSNEKESHPERVYCDENGCYFQKK